HTPTHPTQPDTPMYLTLQRTLTHPTRQRTRLRHIRQHILVHHIPQCTVLLTRLYTKHPHQRLHQRQHQPCRIRPVVHVLHTRIALLHADQAWTMALRQHTTHLRHTRTLHLTPSNSTPLTSIHLRQSSPIQTTPRNGRS
ncbi:hypothetical protein GGI05_003081, partial [Coemansia sp. RSA 2603]